MATEKEYSLDLESGSSQYAYITDANQTGLDITGDFTAEAWVKFETTPAAGVYSSFVSKYLSAGDLRCYTFHLYNDAGTLKIGSLLSDDGIGATHGRIAWTPSLGVWYHVAAVYDASAGTQDFYIDGANIGQAPGLDNSIADKASQFQVGSFNGASFFDGQIAEVRMWDDERTQEEIIKNMFVQLAGSETNLQGYWKFENDYTDETSNSNDLTAVAGPFFDGTTRGVPFTYYLEAGDDNLASLDLEAGSSQYASITDVSQTGLDLSTTGTLEGWFNFESLPGNNAYFHLILKDSTADGRSYVLRFQNNGGTYQLQAGVTDVGANWDLYQYTWTPTLGLWYHLAVTIDTGNASATTFEFFINGVSVGNGAAIIADNISTINDSGSAFYIGIRAATGPFDGKTDDVRVWSDVRTSTEILENKDNYVASNESGLVGNWKLNTDYLDETTNNNDLTASGSPVFSIDSGFDARGSRRSVDFEAGSSEYAYITDANQTGLDLGSTFTLEAWINLESQPGVNGHYTIIGKYDDDGNNRQYRFNYRDTAGTKKLEIIISQDGAGTNDTESVNWTAGSLVWYHVAVTVDIGANEAKFYVDGSQQGSTQTTTITGLADKAEDFRIGASGVGGAPSLFFDGIIDEVRAWNDVRTVTEIADNMDIRLDGDEAGLVSYWQLAGNYVDTTSNENALIPANTPTTTWWSPFDGSVADTALRDIVQPGIVPFLR